MMEDIIWFHEELLVMPLNADTSEDAIRILGGQLLEKGYVHSTFIPAVLERELNFSTGLPTDPIGVAIPHTDAHHVIKPAIAVGISPKPITFHEMGDPDSADVQVRLVLMLAIPDPSQVAMMLKRLVNILRAPGFLAPLAETQDRKTASELLSSQFNPQPK
jgi:PTS system galactitol-specific IIA component